MGERNDIANAALFLASDAASYITGHIMVVDGGIVHSFPNFPLGNKDFVKMWSSGAKL
jgi:hypothetical protein